MRKINHLLLLFLLFSCANPNKDEKKTFYPNGQTKTLVRSFPERDSHVIANFYPRGQLSSVYSTSNGIPNGLYLRYFESGKLKDSVYYKLGKSDGWGVEYYPNGRLKAKCAFENGLIEGEAMYYYANGHMSDYQRRVKNAVYYEERFDSLGKFNGYILKPIILSRDTFLTGEEIEGEIVNPASDIYKRDYVFRAGIQSASTNEITVINDILDNENKEALFRFSAKSEGEYIITAVMVFYDKIEKKNQYLGSEKKILVRTKSEN